MRFWFFILGLLRTIIINPIKKPPARSVEDYSL